MEECNNLKKIDLFMGMLYSEKGKHQQFEQYSPRYYQYLSINYLINIINIIKINKQIEMEQYETLLHSLDCTDYTFRILDSSYQAKTTELLSERFLNQNPFVDAFYQQTSQKASKLFKSRQQTLKHAWGGDFSKQVTSNNLSVGCFHKQSGELIGVSVTAFFGFAPLTEEVMNDVNFLSVAVRLEQALLEQVSPEHKQILSQQKVIDIFGVAIKKEHTGKGLLCKMMLGNEYLAVQQGFEYSFCYTSNIKTTVALRKLGYEKISEGDAWEFQLNGIRYFEKVEEGNRKAASQWIKKIANPS